MMRYIPWVCLTWLLVACDGNGPQNGAGNAPEQPAEVVVEETVENYADIPDNDPVFDDPGNPQEPGYPFNPLGPVPPMSMKNVDFRAATWNMFKMTVKKAKGGNPFGNLTAANKAGTIGPILSAHNVHIAGLQEIYLARRSAVDTISAFRPKASKDQLAAYIRNRQLRFTETRRRHPVLNGSKLGDFTVIPGDPIFRWSDPEFSDQAFAALIIQWHWREYCPIIYRPPVSCDADTSKTQTLALRRKVHSVSCSVNGRQFEFACAHFPAKSRKKSSNKASTSTAIRALDRYLRRHPHIIIAADINSSPYGHLSSVWSESTIHNHIERVRGRYSKLSPIPKTNIIKIASNRRARTIDDVLPYGDPADWYISGSKSVIPIASAHATAFGFPLANVTQGELRKWYSLSDHLPVKADFNVP